MAPSGDGRGGHSGRGKADERTTVRDLLGEHGRTYAEEAGIRLRDTPQPLYELLVLSHLLSARIRAATAVEAARALFDAGMRDARRMRDATWQQRVDALGRGGYRRYDERTSTQLGDAAELVLDRYGGDLRRLREEAGGDPDRLRELLREVPGIGPAGADIFLREVQGVWPDVAPCLDGKALDGARRLELPADPGKLARLVRKEELPSLAAALVRAALDRHVVEDVEEAHARHAAQA
ncbi:HhH-GDP family DNA glycosylase [Streptomyces thermolilacinus]|uniref:Endonuclease n=1 Tax=Streptomyces thermolilacinus SPC6 TaxID=1306406 RepID=A0A1D3DYJ2_9ACTN|nr:endonuclease [Streptomyces thermolilacinus]OEJ97396.1 endonuclease [Streptomyces thermolilacinus SPC6]